MDVSFVACRVEPDDDSLPFMIIEKTGKIKRTHGGEKAGISAAKTLNAILCRFSGFGPLIRRKLLFSNPPFIILAKTTPNGGNYVNHYRHYRS
jgi:hypothetical protein